MKKYIQLVALFVATTSIFAQSQDFQTNYTFSECEGAFPTILNYNITDLVVNSANNEIIFPLTNLHKINRIQ